MAEIEACPYVRDGEPAQETIKPEDTDRGSPKEEFPQPPKEPRRFAGSREDLAKQILRDARAGRAL